MSEPKMESQALTNEEWDQLAKEEREKFQLEREAIEITGEGKLEKIFDELKLAQTFEMKKEVEQKLNEIRILLEEGRQKLEEGGEWHGQKKQMLEELFKSGKLMISNNDTRFELLQNLLKQKAGAPVDLNSEEASQLSYTEGKYTIIPGTSYVAIEYKSGNDIIKTTIAISRLSDGPLNKLKDIIQAQKEQKEKSQAQEFGQSL